MDLLAIGMACCRYLWNHNPFLVLARKFQSAQGRRDLGSGGVEDDDTPRAPLKFLTQVEELLLPATLGRRVGGAASTEGTLRWAGLNGLCTL
ncbi:hypothetical protein HNY73_001552 [Argiope bruennichi]|uniref:Uncharacterized protein n=1 Tax=Argiope bruennichi TaxID=94029 RepID=A0A8T0G1N2_ARGBR|nr:hypothetical protein HNY73_001552 [Argiope bruennichi]